MGSFLNFPPTAVVVLWRSLISEYQISAAAGKCLERRNDVGTVVVYTVSLTVYTTYSAFTLTDNGSDRLADSVSAIECGVALVIKIVSYAFAALRA